MKSYENALVVYSTTKYNDRVIINREMNEFRMISTMGQSNEVKLGIECIPTKRTPPT